MTSAESPASGPVDVPSTRAPAARAAMLEQLREYHRMEAEAEDADDRTVVADLHEALGGRTAASPPSPGG